MRDVYKTKNAWHDRKHIIYYFKRKYFEKNKRVRKNFKLLDNE